MSGLRLAGPLSGTGIGLHLVLDDNVATTYITLVDATIIQFGGNGIDIATPIVSRFGRVYSLLNGGHGYSLHYPGSGGLGTSCSFHGCYANSNSGHGYDLDDIAYSHLAGVRGRLERLRLLPDRLPGSHPGLLRR